MRQRVSLAVTSLLLFVGCDEGYVPPPGCGDRQDEVSVDEPLDALGGESASSRFERAAGPWDCSVTWLALPEQFGTSEPPPGTSPLDFVLERTSDAAAYRSYAETRDEKRRGTGCQRPSVDVPCSLALVSEDGGLDELWDCALRLQGENTLVTLELDGVEFSGSHRVEFVEGVTKDAIGLNLAFTPGVQPERIDATLVESGIQSGAGADPYLTTALIACLPL